MSLKRTGIVALVFLALGAFYYFYVLKTEERKKKAEETAKKVWQVKAEEVEEISLSRDQQEIRLKKNGESYRVVSPVEAKADNKKVASVLTALINAEKDRTLGEDTKELSPFGLDKPSLILAVKLKGGAKRELKLGGLTVTGEHYYGLVPGQKGIFLIAKSTREAVDQSLFDLRDHKVLDFEEMKVDRVEVIRDGLTLAVDVIDKGPPQRFMVKSPLETPGDFDDIRDLLYLLKELKVTGYGEYQPKDLSPYGLDKPSTTVKVWVEGVKEPLVLYLGKKATEEWFYGKRDTTNEVFYLDKKFVQALPAGVNNLRDRHVVIMDVDEVKKAALHRPNQEIVVERKGKEKWELLKPISTPGSDRRITSWLADIRNLKARGFLDEPPANLKSFGLDEPRARVTIWLEKAKEPLILNLGAENKEGLFMKVEAKKTVYLVDAKAAEIFQQDPFFLRDRRFFPYEPEKVGEMLIQKGPFRALMKWEKDRWKLKEPKDAELDLQKGWGLFWTLTREMEFQQESPDKAKKFAPSGLDKPAAIIEMKGKAGEKLDLLRIGKPADSGKQRYAALDSRPYLYLISNEDFKKLPGSWEDLY